MAVKIYEILSNQKFQSLPYEEKKQVLSSLNGGFSGLPQEAQDQVMTHFNLNRPEDPADLNPTAKSASNVYTPMLVGLGGAGGAALAGGLSSPSAAVPPAGAVAIPAATMAGSALGMSAGVAASDLLDRITGLKPPIQSMSQAIGETGSDLSAGATYETLGQMGGAVVSKIGAPFVKNTVKFGTKVAQAAKNLGIELTPSEINHVGTLNLLESVMSWMPGSRDVFARYRLGQMDGMLKQREALLAKEGSPEAIESLGVKIQDGLDRLFRGETKLSADKANAFKNELLRKMGSTQTYEELGMSAQDAIARKSQLLDKASQKLYQNASELIDPNSGIVPTFRTRAWEVMQKEMRGAPSVQDPEAMAILKDLSGWNEIQALKSKFPNGEVPQEIIAQVMNKPVDYGYLAQTRSGLGKIIGEHDKSFGYQKAAQGTKLVSDRTAGVAKQLFQSVDEDLTSLAQANGDDALKALEVARAFYKNSKDIIDNKAIRAIQNSDPSKIVDMVFRPNQITQIRALRSMSGPQEWPKYQNKLVEKIADFGTDNPISGEGLKNRLDSFGKETLHEIFTPDQVNSLYSMAKDIELNQSNTLLNNQFFRSIAKSSPEKVVDVIVKPGNTVNIQKIQDAIGQEGVQAVKEGFIQKLLMKHAQDSHGNFSPTMLDSWLNRYGDRTLKSLYPSDVVASLRDMGNVGARMAKAEKLAANPSGTAQNVVAFRNGEVLLSNPIQGIKLALAPHYAAKLYLNPTTRKWLTDGLFTNVGAEGAQQISSKIISSMVGMGSNWINQVSE